MVRAQGLIQTDSTAVSCYLGKVVSSPKPLFFIIFKLGSIVILNWEKQRAQFI